MMTFAVSFILCLMVSSLISMWEMAYVSANRVKIRELADADDSRARKVARVLDYPQHFLTIILISNNIANVGATALVTLLLKDRFGIENEWLVTAIMAPLLIIFCETVPKDFGRLRAQAVLLWFSGILSALLKIFHKPAIFILRGIDFFIGPFAETQHRSIFVSEEEFRLLIEESTRSGVLGQYEKQLIDTILDFERIQVESVMIPVEKVAKVSITDTTDKVKQIAAETHQRMVLVYEEIPSIIVGMVYVFDLLFVEKSGEPLREYLRSPIFLPRNTSIEKAFFTLQQRRQSFAVVTDVHGEVIGVVPIERLFSL
jgi:putative hemolysin